MNTPHSEQSDRERRLDELVTAYLKAVEAGEKLKREEWLARHPELATELAAFFDAQDQMDKLAGSIRAPSPMKELGAWDALTLPPSEPATPDRALGIVRYFGDYELQEEIARGGMGVVYKARQVSLNRPVALKMILAGQLASEADVHRFRSEAEAAANLDHPNIVPIYEVGEHEGQHYFSMKLIEGSSLAKALASGQWVGKDQKIISERQRIVVSRGQQQRAARLLATVARAVQHAHQRGILHRDLKPGNILLDSQGAPHITDFGLAKRVTSPGPESKEKLTQSGAIVGTPSYMAPEQARSDKALTPAVDVYSLGAVLYELIADRPLFRASTPLDTILQVLHQEPEKPRSLNPNLDRDLETICLKCLQKEAERRYVSAAELADDLGRFADGEPIEARPITRLERLGRWAKRRKTVASVIFGTLIGLAVSLLAAGAWILTHPSKPGGAANESPITDLSRSPGPYKFQIPLDFPALVSIRVADLWKIEATAGFRRQSEGDFGRLLNRLECEVGLKPEKIEQVVLFMRMTDPESTYEINWYRRFPLAIITTNVAFNREAVGRWINPHLPKLGYQGKTYYGFGVENSPFEAFHFVDDRTFLFGSEPDVRGMLKQMALLDTSQPLDRATQEIMQRHQILVGLNIEALFPVVFGDESVQEDLMSLVDIELPQNTFRAPLVTLGLDLGVETKAELELIFPTGAHAAKSASPAKAALALLSRIALRPLQRNLTGDHWGERELKLLDRVRSALERSSIERQGTFLRVNASITSNEEELEKVSAEVAGRIPDVPALIKSADNLRQLAQAFGNYEDHNGSYPPVAISSKEGLPLLSWRVSLLPFLDQNDLFKQFRMDEPWDGPNNIKLLSKMPKVFAPIRGETKVPYATFYQVFTGKSTLFDGSKGMQSPEHVTRPSNTILVAEAADPVPWTKPQDLAYWPDQPLPELGGLFRTGFNAALCDDSVHFIRRGVQEKTMRALITPHGGTNLDWKAVPGFLIREP